MSEVEEVYICRCEEVTSAEIRQAILAGARTVEAVKRRTRAGMGLCQGRTCTRLIRAMLLEMLGPERVIIEPDSTRTPVRSVELGSLGAVDEDA